MNRTKHVAILVSNIFGRGFDSRRLHQYLFYYQSFTSAFSGPLSASLNFFAISAFG
jgi:hypothetical protein